MQVSFDHFHDETDTVRTFYFRPELPLSYTAGQFIQLTLPHDYADDRGTKRWFTLSSSPSQELLSITTRLNPEGSSFKKALQQLHPGDIANISAPMGDFVLPKLQDTPLIFVAAGVGITPFHSILQWMIDTNELRPIRFLYGVRNEEDIIFQETFDKAKQHITIVVSEPSAAWGGERGHISAEMILGLEKPSRDTLIYLSGPEQLVEILHDDLVKGAVHDNQIVMDSFPGYKSL